MERTPIALSALCSIGSPWQSQPGIYLGKALTAVRLRPSYNTPDSMALDCLVSIYKVFEQLVQSMPW